MVAILDDGLDMDSEDLKDNFASINNLGRSGNV